MNRNLRINGETVAVSQQVPLLIEVFLNDNYLFRRNVLNGKVEFKALPEREDAQWRPLTLEALNSIILKAEHIAAYADIFYRFHLYLSLIVLMVSTISRRSTTAPGLKAGPAATSVGCGPRSGR